MQRTSDILTKEIRDAAVTYRRVSALFPDGVYLLECLHVGQDNEHNPSHLDQMRYCPLCTEAKLS